MEQDPNLSKFTTLSDYVFSGMPESSFHLIEITGKSLGIDLEVSISESSGGERRRAALTKLIVGDHDILLLDEPTNHLDMEAVFWLEDYLAQWSKILFFVSHSQDFMNGVCTHIVRCRRGVPESAQIRKTKRPRPCLTETCLLYTSPSPRDRG